MLLGEEGAAEGAVDGGELRAVGGEGLAGDPRGLAQGLFGFVGVALFELGAAEAG